MFRFNFGLGLGLGYRHYNYQASNGLTLMLLGILLGSPFLVGLGYLEYATAPVVYYSIAATSTASATAFSLATVGVGALILYASIGLTYLYSGARECYLTNTNPLDLIKSRIFNKNPLSFNSVVNSIAAVVWSPFLFLGGLAGMAVKTRVKTTLEITLKTTLSSEEIAERVGLLQRSLKNPILQEAYQSKSTSGSFVIEPNLLAPNTGKIHLGLFGVSPTILNTLAPNIQPTIARQCTYDDLADTMGLTNPM